MEKLNELMIIFFIGIGIGFIFGYTVGYIKRGDCLERRKNEK